MLIRIKKLDMPPLVIICSMSGVLIAIIYIVMFFIQMFNINTLEMPFTAYLLIFPLNYIICSIRAVIDIFKKYKEKDLKPKEYKNKFLNTCSKIICNVYNWPILAIVFVVPFIIVLFVMFPALSFTTILK